MNYVKYLYLKPFISNISRSICNSNFTSSFSFQTYQPRQSRYRQKVCRIKFIYFYTFVAKSFEYNNVSLCMCRSWYSPKLYILRSSQALSECLYQHPWYLPLSYCCKITCLTMMFYWIFANYRYSHMGTHLSATSDNSVTSDTIQLLVAIKGNYSGLFFFWTSHTKEKFPRDYVINIATYLTSSAWAIFYFGQVLVFCELFNKNVLGC